MNSPSNETVRPLSEKEIQAILDKVNFSLHQKFETAFRQYDRERESVFQDFEKKVLGVVDGNKNLDRKQTWWISGLAAGIVLTWIIGFCTIKYNLLGHGRVSDSLTSSEAALRPTETKGVESGLQRTDSDTKTN